MNARRTGPLQFGVDGMICTWSSASRRRLNFAEADLPQQPSAGRRPAHRRCPSGSVVRQQLEPIGSASSQRRFRSAATS